MASAARNRLADASSWVFAGTGLHNGDHIPSLIQREADHVDTRFPTPDNVQILLHSPATCAGLGGKPVRGLFSDTIFVDPDDPFPEGYLLPDTWGVSGIDEQ